MDDSSPIRRSTKDVSASGAWRRRQRRACLSRGEDDIAPTVSPDGKWIYYEAAEPKPALMRLPAEGGDAVRIERTAGVGVGHFG